ncbi:MAG: FtsX-like permease family protein [Steroidobacteraceae bacterium]
MQIMPVLNSLRRNRIGAVLIGLQIALTLAILCNSFSVIQQQLRHMVRPTGIDEANIGIMRNQWVGEPIDLKARVLADLAALRSVPGVVDAEAINAFPLGGSAWTTGMKLSPDQKFATAHTAVYLVDDHAMSALGLKLTAGRWFKAGEIGEARYDEDKFPAIVIVTQSLARALFARTSALGQVVYFGGSQPARIVGIVEHAQTPFAVQTPGGAGVDDGSFFPYQYLSNDIRYIVRTVPGQLTLAMKSAQDRLFQITPQRVVTSVQTFAEVRHSVFTSERKSSVVLGALCALLLSVTALGVVGLTMYWVSQRRRYIGMRRALGARRGDILRYLHLENLIIAGGGALLGITLGVGGNVWLATTLALTRMSPAFIGAAAAIVLGLSQLAVIWPALRAASIPPAAAIRGR